MNKTKQEKWQRAYGDTPDSFRQRVAASLPKGEESRHVAFPRRAMVLAAALVLVLTTAYAAVVTQTELVWNAGHPIENEADDRLGLLTGKAGTSGDSLTIGGISMDDRTKTVTVEGEPVSLTPTEYAILHLLMANPGKVFSTKVLYESVWQEAALGSEGAVAVHIRHLREKIEINPSEPRYLKVVWGQGYKMEGGK